MTYDDVVEAFKDTIEEHSEEAVDWTDFGGSDGEEAATLGDVVSCANNANLHEDTLLVRLIEAVNIAWEPEYEDDDDDE